MPAEPEPPKFTPFIGTAKRLVRASLLTLLPERTFLLLTQRRNVADTTIVFQDGKTVVLPPPAAAAGAPGGAASGAGTKDAGAAPVPKSTADKLVFGAKPSAPAAAPAKAAPPPEARADPKGEEPAKFTPFSGTGRKLK